MKFLRYGATSAAAVAMGLALTVTATPAAAQKYQKIERTARTQPVRAVRAPINPDFMTTIDGSLGYRERMLPPPGSVAIVTLQDVSRADAAAQVLDRVEYSVGGHGVPFGYQLKVPNVAIRPGHTYTVRGEIRDQNGNLLWTTDTAQPIDTSLQHQVLPTQMMVKVGRSNPSTRPTGNVLTRTPWRVEYIDGRGVVDNSRTSLQFMPDGSVAGSTGCNQYNGSYSVSGDSISFGQLAVTRRACIPALGDQEARFLADINDTISFDIDQMGNLVLSTSNGGAIVATPYQAAQPY